MTQYTAYFGKRIRALGVFLVLFICVYLFLFKKELMRPGVKVPPVATLRQPEGQTRQGGDKGDVSSEAGLTADEAKTRAEAMDWLSDAYDRGLANKEFNQGKAYIMGQGVGTNLVEAEKWFRKAAEHGHVAAQFQLGTAYLSGQGVETNSTEAVKWFTLSAERGFMAAQYNLGAAYENGEGVARDIQAAYRWFLVASEKGFKPAGTKVESLERTLSPAQIKTGREWARHWKPEPASPLRR